MSKSNSKPQVLIVGSNHIERFVAERLPARLIAMSSDKLPELIITDEICLKKGEGVDILKLAGNMIPR